MPYVDNFTRYEPDTDLDSVIDRKRAFSIRVFLNKVDILKSSKLLYLKIISKIGGDLPRLELMFNTSDKNIAYNAVMECSKIYIELASLDDKGVVFDKRQFMFFVVNAKMIGSQKKIQTNVQIALHGVSDLFDKQTLLGTPVKINVDGKTIDTLDKIFDFEAKDFRDDFVCPRMFDSYYNPDDWGSPESKIHKLDMIESRSIDTQKRNIFNVSKLSAINSVIATSKLQNDTPIGHFFDCDKDGGALCLTLFDLVTRCQSFQPESLKYLGNSGFKAKFALNTEDRDTVTVDSMELDIKGAEHSNSFWNRPVDMFDPDEYVVFVESLDAKSLFSDGMEYADADGLSALIPPSDYSVFRSGVLLNRENDMADNNDRGAMNNRAIYLRYTMALEKVNYKLALQGFLGIKLADICEIKYPDYFDADRKDESLLSGKAMITSVIYELSEGKYLNTFLVASRDSFVKG